ncbi:dihydroorotate dehydrogenase [Thermoplasmatales archaeon SG8-52-2]|nr:MAG: dihydroorotate dehydrogenase [Thermoplasmatales archaeon SG8-52-2]
MKLDISLASLNLNNPLILASGIMDEDAGSMKRIFNCGAGAIVTKSIGLKPREGYPNPTVIELEHGILNAIGLSNPGIENFENEIADLKKSNIPVIGSIFGSDNEEFVILSKKMQNYGVDALELNMSCPHAKGYGLEIGCDPDLVKDITSEVKKSTKIPIFVKISPNLSNIIEIAKSAEEGNADGIVAINTVKAMKIDLELQMPVLSNKIGGYSGNAIKPIGVRCVYEISKNIDIPLIGVGGISSGEDAIEYLMAGASAVQIGSGIYYRGVDVFKKILIEIKTWMKDHKYENLTELLGVAHK